MRSEPSDLTPKARRTLSLLISAAETVIGQEGVRAVTVMSVCEEAGVGRTSFYNYFEDVEALTNAVATNAAKQIKSQFDHLHVGVPRGSARLEACLSMIVQLAIEDSDRMLLLTSLADTVPEVSGLLEAEITAELAAKAGPQISEAKTMGRFLTVALLALARQFAEGAIPREAKGDYLGFLRLVYTSG